VRYGGHQDAKDGGFDVVVDLPTSYPLLAGGYIRKHRTAFQCKKPSIGAAGIKNEMRPNGKLRPSIMALPKKSSAYVIVSSGSSITQSALDSRVAAMREAASTWSKFLTLDFYDRNHIATWVRDYPGVVVWLRDRVGTPLRGWRPHGPWASDGEFVPDTALRIHLSDRTLDPVAGVTQLRTLLTKPGAVVRLVGHSGLGKTRLLQALFDGQVGSGPLDPALAIYTDMELTPDPTPAALLQQLIAESRRAIVVVDNCDSHTHRSLTGLCANGQTSVSLVTVEYEIREDEPEGTEVVRIDAASDDFIERLLRLRYPKLAQSNAKLITKFAGGNSRLAIAIAGTVRAGQSVAQLKDAQFFHRLFHQRKEDQSLLRAARVLSLVFSLDGEGGGEESELARLSSFSGIPIDDLYRHLAALRKKGIVQTRGVWRALLPEAIGNFLAREALEDYPPEQLEKHFREGPARLLKSFARRLGYLHTSQRAVEITGEWLRDGGWLSKLVELDEFHQTIFKNIASTNPEAALAAIERAVSLAASGEELRLLSWCLHVLSLIAFDSGLFCRCISAMATLLGPVEAPGRSRFRDDFKGLFYVHYSGTEATIHQRLLAIQDLLQSEVQHQRDVALLGLEGTLSTYFQWRIRSDFGARLRDHGYWPAGKEQITEWFSAAIALAADLATGEDAQLRGQAREILANHLPGIWKTGFADAELGAACQRISAKKYYWQGWLAVRKARHPEGAGTSPNRASLARVLKLEAHLRPKSILDETTAVLLCEEWSRVSLSLSKGWATIDPNSERVESKARDRAEQLGKSLADNEVALKELAPLLFVRAGAYGRCKAFGKGLAHASPKRHRTWTRLRSAFLSVEESQRRIDVLCGFLEGLSECDRALLARILDDSLALPALARYLPQLQVCDTLDARGVSRLIQSLKAGVAETWRFKVLWNLVRPLSPPLLRSLLQPLAARADGLKLAVDILANYVESLDSSLIVDEELRSIAVSLVSLWQFSERDDHFDRDLATIIRYSLRDERGAEVAFDIWRRAPQSEAAFAIGIQCDDTLSALMEVQPLACLDGLLAGNAEDLGLVTDFLDMFQGQTNPLDVIDLEAIFKWCDSDPSIRYPVIAEGITIAEDLNKPGVKWSARAEGLLARAPEPQKIISAFLNTILHPVGWVGSDAQAIRCNFALLDALEGHPRRQIRDLLPEARRLVTDRLNQARQREASRARREGSFE